MHAKTTLGGKIAAALASRLTPQSKSRQVLSTTLLTMSVVVASLVSFASPAAASDWGGYADPASSRCGSNFDVKQAEVVAEGVKVGTLKIKYSNGCPGNYAKFEAEPGFLAVFTALSIHSQVAPFDKAGADEEHETAVYTKVIELENSSDRVCAYLDVTAGRMDPGSTIIRERLTGSSVLCA